MNKYIIALVIFIICITVLFLGHYYATVNRIKPEEITYGQFDNISSYFKQYYYDNGKYPVVDLDKQDFSDGWGTRIIIEIDYSKNLIKLHSFGKNKIDDNEKGDDIIFTEIYPPENSDYMLHPADARPKELLGTPPLPKKPIKKKKTFGDSDDIFNTHRSGPQI